MGSETRGLTKWLTAWVERRWRLIDQSDVERTLGSVFWSSWTDQEAARRLISRLDRTSQKGGYSAARLKIDVLSLSRGDLDALKTAVDLALEDAGAVLVAADAGRRAHEETMKSIGGDLTPPV